VTIFDYKLRIYETRIYERVNLSIFFFCAEIIFNIEIRETTMILLDIFAARDIIVKLARLRFTRHPLVSAKSTDVPPQLHDYESMIQCFGSRERMNRITRIGRTYSTGLRD